MTRELIAEGRKHDEAMTQGNAVAGLYRSDLIDEQVAQFREAHAEHAGAPMHVVAVAESFSVPIWVSATCIATTGNGPHGAADAAGIAWMRTNLRALLDGYAAALEELGHATMHEGDWLSKTSRLMCETLMGDRERLRADVIQLTRQRDEARADADRLRRDLDDLR